MGIKDFLLSEFSEESTRTRVVLTRLPAAALAWKPHPKSFPLGSLAGHLANIPSWCILALSRDDFDLSVPAANPRPLTPTSSPSAILEAFDEYSRGALNLLASTTDSTLMEPWTLRNADRVSFTIPRARVIRVWVINHMIHHRAQLGVYLRLLDLPVPATYGPSADEEA